MERIMKKQELIDELASRTEFYKKNMKVVVEALEDIILENLQSAELGQDSELHLAPGVVICGQRTPQREAKDPRNGEIIITPEKVIPYAVFKTSIRQKLYKKTNKKGRK